MARTIQNKRGLEKNLPTLATGEFALTTDTKKVFVGTDNGNVEVTNKDAVDNLTTALAETTKQINETKTDISTNYAKKTDVNSLASGKAEKSYVDQQISNIGNASPKGTYATLAALQSAFPTGTTGIYLVTADGKWYYWSGSVWTAGGIYQATALGTDTATLENVKYVDLGKFAFSSSDSFNISAVKNAESNNGVITVTGDLWLRQNKFKQNSNLPILYFGKSNAEPNGWNRPVLRTGSNSNDFGTYTFPINHNDFLIFDLNTNEIIIKTANSTFTKYDILLAFWHNGELKGGVFFELLNWLNLKALLPLRDFSGVNLGQFAFSGYDDPFKFTPNGNGVVIETVIGSQLWIKFSTAKKSDSQLYIGTENGTYGTPIFSTGGYTDETKRALSFTVEHNSLLLYNIKTNTIFKKSSAESYTFDINDRLLAFVHAGEVKGGIFNDIKNWWRIKKNETEITSLKTDITALKNGGIVLSDYVKSEINSMITSVFNKQTVKSSSFAFITDLHYYTNMKAVEDTIKALTEISKQTDIGFTAFGGDLVSDGNKKDMLSFYDNLRYKFRGLLPSMKLMPVKGNHDDGTIWNVSYHPELPLEYINHKEMYVRSFKQIESYGLRGTDQNSLYYYFDDPNSKIRYIFLNNIDIPYIVTEEGKLKYKGQWDYAFSNAQLNWLANTALNLTGKGDEVDDWAVLFIGHIPPIHSLSFTGDATMKNAEVFVGIAQAFKNGTSYTSAPTTGDFAQSVSVDFASQGAKDIIAYVYGHIHEDRINVVDGIPYISTLNANGSKDNPQSPTRSSTDISLYAFDIFTVNRDERKIFTTRFGAGVDREVSY